MVFLSDLVWLASELLTLGGVERLKDAKRDYNEAYEQYQEIGGKIDCIYNENKVLLLDIGNKTKLAFKALRKAENMLRSGIKSLTSPSHDSLSISNNAVTRIDKLNDQYSSVLSAGSGAVSGGALALGSWTLVSVVGAASTGTAISSLSGIAATNATLAWFGGGALAAGGAGMAGGTLVLGGIAAFPLIFIWGFTIHKKARKLEEGTLRINDILPSVLTELEKAETDNRVIKSKHLTICKACRSFIHSVEDARKKVFKFGLLSHFYKCTKRIFGFSYYTKAELEVLSKLESEVEVFILLFE